MSERGQPSAAVAIEGAAEDAAGQVVRGLLGRGLDGGLRFWEIITIFGLTMGLTFIAIYAATSGHALLTFGILALVGTAAWMSGAVLGFLFGVPRLRASVSAGSTGAGSGAPGSGMFAPNTNLEQISDWLTKIIVGATLVQLGTIAQEVNALALAIGAEMGVRAGAAVSGAVMVLFFAGGFMWGYLWCSLRVFREMAALVEREQAVTSREVAVGAAPPTP